MSCSTWQKELTKKILSNISRSLHCNQWRQLCKWPGLDLCQWSQNQIFTAVTSHMRKKKKKENLPHSLPGMQTSTWLKTPEGKVGWVFPGNPKSLRGNVKLFMSPTSVYDTCPQQIAGLNKLTFLHKNILIWRIISETHKSGNDFWCCCLNRYRWNLTWISRWDIFKKRKTELFVPLKHVWRELLPQEEWRSLISLMPAFHNPDWKERASRSYTNQIQYNERFLIPLHFIVKLDASTFF